VETHQNQSKLIISFDCGLQLEHSWSELEKLELNSQLAKVAS